MKVKDMTLIAVMAALICLCGPLSVEVGPVPVSLCSFAVYLAGAMLGWKRGCAAVAVYLMIGLVGLPVFAGFSGGFSKLVGVTGGYLIGYVPCALIAGLGVDKPGEGWDRAIWVQPALMLASTAALYLIGTVWFILETGSTLASAMGVCVVPFLPGDAIKIVAACLIAAPVRKAIAVKA